MTRNRMMAVAFYLTSIFCWCAINGFSEVKQPKIIAQLKKGSLIATVTINTPTIPFDTLFYLTVKTTSDESVYNLINFDAIMGAHNHGMIVKPKITKVARGEWRIDGVKLHMRGEWKFIFEWIEKEKKTNATYDIVI